VADVLNSEIRIFKVGVHSLQNDVRNGSWVETLESVYELLDVSQGYLHHAIPFLIFNDWVSEKNHAEPHSFVNSIFNYSTRSDTVYFAD
jgi:hypothetical protein